VKELIEGNVALETPKKSVSPEIVTGVDGVHTGDRSGTMRRGERGKSY
jgi:hypothetical protein